MAGATAGDGSWNEGVTTRTKTTTRTYTDSDGTLITEVSFPYDNLIFTGSNSGPYSSLRLRPSNTWGRISGLSRRRKPPSWITLYKPKNRHKFFGLTETRW